MREESIKYSLNNLKQRKTRSFFTILSIFIGIATVFIFISYGLGLYNYIDDFTSGGTANKVIIQPKSSQAAAGIDTTFKLTEDDLEEIEKTSGVYDAAGIYFQTAEIKKNNELAYTFVAGYDPDRYVVIEAFDLEIYEGRELNQGDRVAVLGYNFMLDDKIFPKGYSLGENIEIQGQKVRIVGFYDSIGNPQDDAQIYVTDDFMKELYPEKDLSYNMIVASVDTSDIDRVVENIEDNLRDERDLEEGKEDFYVQSFADLIESYSNILNIVIGFVILIALISVLVSGVNTANTMITSVLERRKEIGIMKSIGARNSEIFKIFLFESSFLGFIAGVIGVCLGWAVSSIGGVILDNLGYSFLQPAFPPLLFIGCIAFATLTGAISGAIPAHNATKVDPVEALRYE